MKAEPERERLRLVRAKELEVTILRQSRGPSLCEPLKAAIWGR